MRIFFPLLLVMFLFDLHGQPMRFDLQKEGEWILMMEPGSDIPVLEGATLIRTLSRGAGAFLIGVAAEAEDVLREQLKNERGFLALQPNYYLSPRGLEPDDPYFDSQWNLERIQATDAWTLSTGGTSALGDEIAVAVIDDGFDLEHPDLAGNILGDLAWNFDTGSPILPVKSHGTAVAGILGGVGNNGTGIAGVNWNVKIIPLVVRTIGHIIEAYDYALDLRKEYNESGGAEGAFVVATSASLGFDKLACTEYPVFNSMLDSLGKAGVLSVAATANGNWNVDEVGDIPTSCASDFLISVTNSDRGDRKYEEAAYGPVSIDLAAPGGSPEEGAYTLRPPGGYDQSFGGTSAACPHVSGAVALLYSMPSPEFAQMAHDQPMETALLVKEAILEGADSIFALQGITLTGSRLNLFRSALYLHGVFQPKDFVDPAQYTDRRRLIRVFPNPVFSGQQLEIVYGSRTLEPVTLRFFNSLGQVVMIYQADTQGFADQLITLPTANLAAGTYWVVLENGISPIAEKIIVY